MEEKTCCFWGHRKIYKDEKLEITLDNIIENLIIHHNVRTFLFGSRSEFDSLCHERVSLLKIKYPYIKRIYVRAEYPNIDQSYLSFLLKSFEQTYYPPKISKAGKATYIERNYELINKSCFCVVYYNESLLQTGKRSGTKIALDYARKKGKKIILIS